MYFSAHGTFIGNIRLERHKPTQLPIDSSFHFGASTRKYIIRERPQAGPRPIMEELERSAASDTDGRLMGLPETESELDNLTEFNTAHNRRITMIGKYQHNIETIVRPFTTAILGTFKVARLFSTYNFASRQIQIPKKINTSNHVPLRSG